MKRFMIFALTLSACSENEECRQLAKVLAAHEEVHRDASQKASAHDRIEKSVLEAQKRGQAYLDEFGLDDAEEDLAKVLEQRVAAVPGAAIEKHARKNDAPQSAASRRVETVWSITYSATTLRDGIDKAWSLAASPPLFLVERIEHAKGSEQWKVDLARAIVERVPIKPKPIPLAELPSAADVKSEFGFCGALKLRSRIDDLRSQIDGLRDKAEKLTVILPTLSSWQGIERRAQLLNEVEVENRRVMKTMLDGIAEAQINLIGIGYDEPEIVFEASGDKIERERLERALAAHATDLKNLSAAKGVIRMSMANRKMTDARRRPEDRVPPEAPE